MAQLLVKVGDQSNVEVHAKDGDVLRVHADGQGWGRCESLEVWKSEGLDPKDWPGGFLIVQVPDAQVVDLVFLTKRPQTSTDEQGLQRARAFNYKTTPIDLSKNGTITLDKTQTLALASVKPDVLAALV